MKYSLIRKNAFGITVGACDCSTQASSCQESNSQAHEII